MSLRNLEQENILTNNDNSYRLSFWKKVSLAIWAFVLSTNLALAEPNKTISRVDFIDWWSAELYKDNKWLYQIRNWNSKNGSDFIYGTTIINGKKYIVYSLWYNHDIQVFLESDLEKYREYLTKYGEERAYKLIKAREQYIENFLKDNHTFDTDSDVDISKRASESWELVLKKIDRN